MTVEISSENPRSIRAVELAAGASSWLKCRSRDGQQRKAYGVPSRSRSGVYHLVTCETCDCQDFKRIGTGACMHVLAVRLHCELVKASQPKPKKAKLAPTTSGVVLDLVREPDGTLSWERAKAARYDAIFGSDQDPVF